MKALIKVNGVTKKFGNFKALDEINMNVKKGSIYGLVGANGAGKTTLINHLTGALKPDKGEIYINGEGVFENKELKQKVLSIADDWYFYGSYSLKEMAAFYENMYKSFSRERYEKLGEKLISDDFQKE